MPIETQIANFDPFCGFVKLLRDTIPAAFHSPSIEIGQSLIR